MARISILRHLCKNTSVLSAVKVDQRTTALVATYSRFVSQLNSWRSPGRPATVRTISANSQTLEFHPPQKSHFPSSETRIEIQANEDVFMYNQVDRGFVKRFLGTETKFPSHEIAPVIEQLEKFSRGQIDSSYAVHESHPRDLFRKIEHGLKTMSLQDIAILSTYIRRHEGREFAFVRKLIDLHLTSILETNLAVLEEDTDLWFYLADTFYGTRKAKFIPLMVGHLSTAHGIHLTNTRFVHLLFLIITVRQPSLIFAYHAPRIRKLLKCSSIGVVSLISSAYFKTMTQIGDIETFKIIVDRTIENLPSIQPDQPCYCSIIKSLRYSSLGKHNRRSDVARLLASAARNREIILASPYNTVHTLKLMETYRIFDIDLIDLLTRVISEEFRSYRAKDIQYALSSLSNIAYETQSVNNYLVPKLDEICENFVDESRFDKYFHYKHLIPMLRTFAILGYTNDKFISYINHAFQTKSMFQAMSETLEFGKTALLTFVSTRLEGGKVAFGEGNEEFFRNLSASLDRNGNVGSVRQDNTIKHLNFVLKSGFCPRRHVFSVRCREVAELLANSDHLRGSAYHFNFDYIFPHQNFSSLIISKDFNCPGRFDPETLMPRQVPKGQRHCSILASSKHDYVDSNERLSGYKQLVTRLLKKLGYKVVHLNIDEVNIEKIANEVRLAFEASSHE